MADNKLGEAYVEVRAKTDKLQKDLNTAKTTTQKATKSMGAAFSSLKGVIAGAGIAIGVTALFKVLKDSIRLANEQEKAEKKLTAALGYRSQALYDYASAQQKVTVYGDEAIIMAQASISAFTKDEKQIKALTQASLDYASANGVDLVSSAKLIAKTFGSSTNALMRYGIEVTGAVGSTERLKTLTENTAKLFGGMAQAEAKTFGGELQQIKNSAGDVQEKFGMALIPSLRNLATAFGSVEKAGEDVSPVFKTIGSAALVVSQSIKNIVAVVAFFVNLWVNVAKAVYEAAQGNFTKAFDLIKKNVSDRIDDIINYGDAHVQTYNRIKELWRDPSKYMPSPATFNFSTGKIEPFTPNKPKVTPIVPDPKPPAGPTELTNVEQILAERTELQKKINEINSALETGKYTEQEVNDLLLARFELMQQMQGLTKPDEPLIDLGIDELEEPEILDDVEITTDNIDQKMSSIVNAASNLANVLGIAGDSFLGSLIASFDMINGIANSILGIINAFTGGSGGGILGLLFGKKGGAFENGQQVAKFAGGGDFKVPSGFSNDSFPMMVQSGERVQVTPSGRIGEESKLLAAIGGKLDALNKNLTTKNMSPIINLDIDGKKLVREVTLPNENRLRKTGLKLDEL